MHKPILAAGLMLILSPLCLAAPIYKWVDAQGVTHFDAQPPAGQASSLVKPASGNQPAPPATLKIPTAAPIGDQQAADAKVKKQIAEQNAKRKEYCDMARTNLAQLQNNPRLREEVDGELRRLSDEERQTRLLETNKAIEENCS